jgi:hypothetical protein
MLKKTIKYLDLDGNPVEDDFWFHLSTADILEMETEVAGGLTTKLTNMTKPGGDQTQILATFKDLVARSCGQRSDDGKRFIRTPEAKSAFLDSDAYSRFLMELMSGSDAAVEFIKGVVPADMKTQVQAQVAKASADAKEENVDVDEHYLLDASDYSDEELLDLDDDLWNVIVGPVKPGMAKRLLYLSMKRRSHTKGGA